MPSRTQPAPHVIITPAVWVERPEWQRRDRRRDLTPFKTNIPILMLVRWRKLNEPLQRS